MKENKIESIKIKINGKERPFAEEPVIHDWKVASAETSATISEDSKDEDEFEWILPNEDKKTYSDYQNINVSTPRKKSSWRRNWRRMKPRGLHPGIKGMIFSFSLAVVVGLILGSLFLKFMFTDENENIIASKENSPAVIKEDDQPKNIKNSQIEIPQWKMSVIQGGVFSSKERAEARADVLESDGQATTIIPIDELFYVFIGTSGELQSAKAIENKWKEEGIGEGDVWAKELTIPKKELNFTSQEEAEQFVKEVNLYQSLITEVSKLFITGEINRDLLEEGSTMLEQPNYQHDVANELRSKLMSAVKGLQEIEGTSNNEAGLIKVKQSLLDYMKVYMGISESS